MIDSKIWSITTALILTGSVSGATLQFAGKYAPLIVFSLLLVLHTMLPISKIVACTLATIITTAQLAISIANIVENNLTYLQVG